MKSTFRERKKSTIAVTSDRACAYLYLYIPTYKACHDYSLAHLTRRKYVCKEEERIRTTKARRRRKKEIKVWNYATHRSFSEVIKKRDDYDGCI